MKSCYFIIGTLILAFMIFFAGSVIAADFDGDSREDVAIFRPSTGLWSVRNVTRVYYGQSNDEPRPGDYTGDGIADIAIFRPSSGLWAVRGVTRVYYGASSDTSIRGGGGERLYDYVVRPGDADDLVAALESFQYRSVYIPAGTYYVDEVINVGHVRRISGEEQRGTEIIFDSGSYLSIQAHHCHVEGIRVEGGGVAGRGNIWTNADYVTFRECLSTLSESDAFRYDAAASYVSYIDCLANQTSGADTAGFRGPAIDKKDVRFTNCVARRCDGYGFYFCYNLSSCYVYGGDETGSGYYYSSNISSSIAVACSTNGFVGCRRISACEVDGGSVTGTGFRQCSYLAACRVDGLAGGGTEYYNCNWRDPDSCD